MTDRTQPDRPDSSFLDASSQQASGGLLSEFFGFMRENAKWWLMPFLIVFGLLGVAMVLGSTGAAPFIYTLF